jgi:hypothetical protein
MEQDKQAEVILLEARLSWHIQSFNESVHSGLSDGPSAGWRNRHCARNWSVDRSNREVHYKKVHELADLYFELTGNHFPLGFWLERVEGLYNRSCKKVQ